MNKKSKQRSKIPIPLLTLSMTVERLAIKKPSELSRHIEEQPIFSLKSFIKKRYRNFSEKLKCLQKMQKFFKVSQKKNQRPIHFNEAYFVFKQDLTLARNKSRKYAIKLPMLK